mmetsp:Transcript_38760/g.62764  ORF Transcript_38760/g.62764 Transcript_38760/m.62764 type:complete len:317 (+) Transcript_38760:370-1320(+)
MKGRKQGAGFSNIVDQLAIDDAVLKNERTPQGKNRLQENVSSKDRDHPKKGALNRFRATRHGLGFAGMLGMDGELKNGGDNNRLHQMSKGETSGKGKSTMEWNQRVSEEEEKQEMDREEGVTMATTSGSPGPSVIEVDSLWQSEPQNLQTRSQVLPQGYKSLNNIIRSDGDDPEAEVDLSEHNSRPMDTMLENKWNTSVRPRARGVVFPNVRTEVRLPDMDTDHQGLEGPGLFLSGSMLAGKHPAAAYQQQQPRTPQQFSSGVIYNQQGQLYHNYYGADYHHQSAGELGAWGGEHFSSQIGRVSLTALGGYGNGGR